MWLFLSAWLFRGSEALRDDAPAPKLPDPPLRFCPYASEPLLMPVTAGDDDDGPTVALDLLASAAFSTDMAAG